MYSCRTEPPEDREETRWENCERMAKTKGANWERREKIWLVRETGGKEEKRDIRPLYNILDATVYYLTFGQNKIK